MVTDTNFMRWLSWCPSPILLALLLAACGEDVTTGPTISELAKSTGAPPGLSAKVISSEDLPPDGTRSLFDHLVAANESLPYPFEKLVAMVRANDPAGAAPVALLIPRGRSLLKAQADFPRPRALIAADFQAPDTDAALGVNARGALFLGFVEDAAEIEVISYNEAAGRYEFQLVQDYREGGQPRIVYARRAICTTCHQGGAPIFPQRPWNETNGQPEIAAKIAKARGADTPYMGIPIAQPLGAPERFDQLTDVADFVPAAQRTWLDGCGEGPAGAACRRQMLKVALEFALNPGSFDNAGASAAELRKLQAAHWPADGIAVAESDLRNRDPLAEAAGIGGFFRAMVMNKSTAPGAKTNEDLAAFEKLPKLPAHLDPLSPRTPKRIVHAADLDGAFGLSQLLTASDVKKLDAAAGFSRDRLMAAVGRVDAGFFEPAPFMRQGTVNALLVALKKKPLATAMLDTSEMSPPQALGVPPLVLAEGSPLAPFSKYCFACHRGNPAKRLNFMAGKDEAETLANLKAKAEIRDALDWERYRGTDKANKLMPPGDSHQRAALEAALAKDPQLLDDMRKVVPSLFDF